jgi:RNA polymerase sigma-70 factor (ECF subfamily)
MDPSVPDLTAVVDDRDLLDGVLRRLEPDARAMVVLRYYLGMSVPEVADALGVPLGTAKAKLHRSMASMRSTLMPRRGFDGSPRRQSA